MRIRIPLLVVSSFIFLLVFSSPSRADDAKLSLVNDVQQYSLNDVVSYYEDESAKLTFNDIFALHNSGKFKHLETTSDTPGFTGSAYWYHVTLDNKRSTNSDFLLEVAYSMLDYVDFYIVHEDGSVDHQYSGDSYPFGQRPVEHRFFLFEFTPLQGEQTELFIRIQTSSSLQARMQLWEKDTFNVADQYSSHALGFYYGVLLAMLLYNLLVYISLRDKIYLFYVAHVLTFSLLMSALNGLAYQYLWPGLTGWQSIATAVLATIACFCGIQFTRELLRLDKYLPRWDRFFSNFMIYLCVLFALTLIVPYEHIVQLCTVTGLVVSILLNVVGWIRLKHESRLAKYYVLAWSSFLLGATVYALKTYGLLPQVFITEYAMQIGSMLDVVLLSMVLTYRVKMLQEKNVEIQLQATTDLERKVKERTRKLNETLDALSDSYAKVEKLNYTDPLTDIKNRRFFDEFYLHEMNNAIRSKGSIALLVLDIDRFKRVNDEFGHSAGDKVLTCIGQLIAENLPRKNDFVARYGGDEFVIVLPFTNKEGALLTAQRIKNSIAELQVVHENRVITATISIGISAMQPSRETDMDRLIKEADHALYEAKELGRDRIRCYHNGDVELKDVDS